MARSGAHLATWLVGLLACAAFVAPSAVATPAINFTSPVDKSLITESTFPLSYATADIAAPKVVCLVDGRVPDQPLFCDPDAGLARLVNGFHRLKLIAWDTSGTKVVAYRTVNVTIADDRAPEITSALPVGAVIDGSDAPFLFTSLGGAVFECRVDDGGGQACGPAAPSVDPVLGTFMPRALHNGPATLRFESTDVNRRTGRLDKSVVVDDTTPPTLTVGSPGAGATVTESPLRLSFSIGGEYARLVCRVDGGTPFECAGDDLRIGAGTTQLLPLANGGHAVELIALDLVGNATSVLRSFTVDDSTAPAVSITAPGDGHVFLDESMFDLLADHSPGLVECRFRPAAFTNCGDALGVDGVSDADSADLPHPGANGAFHALDVRVTDPMGRVTLDAVTFGIDDATPTDAFVVTPTTETVTRWFPILLSEYGDRSRCTFRIDDGPFTGCDDGRGLDLVEISLPGDHLIVIRVVDGVGNVQTLLHRVRVGVEASVVHPQVTAAGLGAVLTINRARMIARGRHLFLPLSGRLVPRGGATARQICGGFVRINVRLARRHYLVRRPRLRRKGAYCVYSVRARVRKRVMRRNRSVVAVAKARKFGRTLSAKRRFAVPAVR